MYEEEMCWRSRLENTVDEVGAYGCTGTEDCFEDVLVIRQ